MIWNCTMESSYIFSDSASLCADAIVFPDANKSHWQECPNGKSSVELKLTVARATSGQIQNSIFLSHHAYPYLSYKLGH